MKFKIDKESLFSAKSAVFEFLTKHKIVMSVTAAALALSVVSASAMVHFSSKAPLKDSVSVNSENSKPESETEVLESVSEASSAESYVSSTSSVIATPKPTPKPTVTPAPKPAVTAPADGYNYNTSTDIDNNVFLDSLIYTGYNIKKHRADGMMWQYVYGKNKKALGYLSKITYRSGSTGYETVNGRPNISYFEKNGFVCASYVTYVYFNYLPNVAGINTHSLPKPDNPKSAQSWYNAAKQWVNKGYSRKISFTASKTGSGFLKLNPAESIPIGSIMVFKDYGVKGDVANHVAIYAGHKNYHWVMHVGNKNGPEFCTVERMLFGNPPQWPVAIITPPSNIRMAALLEATVTDDSGAPLSGINISIKNSNTGAVLSLGTTDKNGKVKKEGLSYGNYTLSYSVPSGYTSASTTKEIKLLSTNNSANSVIIKLDKIPEPKPDPIPSESESSSESSEVSTPEDGLPPNSKTEDSSESDTPNESE